MIYLQSFQLMYVCDGFLPGTLVSWESWQIKLVLVLQHVTWSHLNLLMPLEILRRGESRWVDGTEPLDLSIKRLFYIIHTSQISQYSRSYVTQIYLFYYTTACNYNILKIPHTNITLYIYTHTHIAVSINKPWLIFLINPSVSRLRNYWLLWQQSETQKMLKD